MTFIEYKNSYYKERNLAADGLRLNENSNMTWVDKAFYEIYHCYHSFISAKYLDTETYYIKGLYQGSNHIEVTIINDNIILIFKAAVDGIVIETYLMHDIRKCSFFCSLEHTYKLCIEFMDGAQLDFDPSQDCVEDKLSANMHRQMAEIYKWYLRYLNSDDNSVDRAQYLMRYFRK